MEQIFGAQKRFFLTFLLGFALIFISSCKQRDPNPENKDPVYAEIGKHLAEAKNDLVYVKSYLDEGLLDLNSAKPQSGEYTVFKKRVDDGQKALAMATQTVRMYEVRLEERKIYVQRRYLESLTEKGRKWPDEGELKEDLEKLKILKRRYSRVKDVLPSTDVPRGTSATK